jgi:hypothetical protein
MRRFDMAPKRMFENVEFFNDPLRWAKDHLDAETLERNKYGRRSYKLGDVYRSTFGEDFECAHTALADARAMLRLMADPSFSELKFGVDTAYNVRVDRFIDAGGVSKKRKQTTLLEPAKKQKT